MKFTLRSLIEFILGMGLVIYAVYFQFSGQKTTGLTDLLMALVSLSGIVLAAHAIWLMRRTE